MSSSGPVPVDDIMGFLSFLPISISVNEMVVMMRAPMMMMMMMMLRGFVRSGLRVEGHAGHLQTGHC